MPFLLIWFIINFMDFQAKLMSDLKEAMKAGASDKVNVFRMLNAALKNKAIEKGKDAVLTEEEAMQVLLREAKKRKESVEAFEKGGRGDLAEKEKKELVILQSYLPEQLSEAEIAKIIEEQIAVAGATGSADAGRVIGQVMAKVKGQADGAIVAGLVKAKLSNG